VGRWNVSGILWAALAVPVIGCGSSTGPDLDDPLQTVLSAPQELMLGYGEEKSVGGSVLRVAFVRVVKDSRCPVDVVCVWAGNAAVELGIRMGMDPTFPLQIDTTLEPRFTDWNDVRVTILELLPQPREGDPPRPEGYTVKIRLQRIF
jgi:hypothetical protein